VGAAAGQAGRGVSAEVPASVVSGVPLPHAAPTAIPGASQMLFGAQASAVRRRISRTCRTFDGWPRVGPSKAARTLVRSGRRALALTLLQGSTYEAALVDDRCRSRRAVSQWQDWERRVRRRSSGVVGGSRGASLILTRAEGLEL
jgi:hypothetical protein